MSTYKSRMPDARRKGGRSAALVLLPVLVIILAACTQAPAPPQKPTLSTDPVVRWIQQNAIPLRTTDQGGSDSDLAPLQRIVGQASIVGLGEETHGTHEFIDIKARLTEFLISKMGFNTFVMENNWGNSQLLDAYINGGTGDLTQIMSRSLFGSWQTQEYQTLFAWMRAYNADPAHTTKIHFLGMDLQAISQNQFDAVENYVQTVDPAQKAHIQALYAPIIASSLPDPYFYTTELGAPAKQQFQNQAQQVYNILQTHQQDYIKRSSPQSFALALQNARVLVQFTTFLNRTNQAEASARYYQRDNFMAENVAWIYGHEAGSNPKMIVWAHDGHIANNPLYQSPDGKNMGGDLKAQFKEKYLPIGTTLYQGSARIYDYPKGIVQSIAPLTSDTYNYTLGKADIPVYMLDLRKIPPGPAANWANSSTTRLFLYGLGGEDLSEICALSQWFDAIVHVQNTTPSQHF